MDRNPELLSSRFSSTSSDGDDVANTQYYKDRIEALMKTLSHYQKVVKREQAMNENLHSVNESIRDLQLSSGEMQLEIQKKDGIISVLQNRLAHLGASTDISLSEDEPLVLASRENFESLLQENRKLKESLKYSSFDPNSLETTLRHLRTLQTEHKALQTKNQQLELEFDRLKKSSEQSEDEKVRQIVFLRDQLEEATRSTDVHSTLCQSLVDEKQQLKQQLQQTISMCQKLQRDLNESFKAPIGKTGESSMHLETENRSLKDRLHAVSQDRAKILAHNAEWQSYESERQDHVGKLQREVTDLRDRLAKSRDAQDTGFSEEQQKEVDKIVMQYKSKLTEAEKKRQEILDENRELRQDRTRLQRELQDAKQDLLELGQNMQSMTDQVEEGNRIKERIPLLEEQLKIYQNDFESERRDREQAVARVHSLENDMRFYKQYHEQHTRRGGSAMGGMDDIAARRQQALNQYQQDYYLQQQASQRMFGGGAYEMVQSAGCGSGRRIEADGQEARPTLAHEDTIGFPAQFVKCADDGRSSIATNPDIPERAVTARGISGHEAMRESTSGNALRHAKTTGDIPSSDLDVFSRKSPSVAATDINPLHHHPQQPKSNYTLPHHQQRTIFDSPQSSGAGGGTIFDNEEKRRSFESSQSGGSRSSTSGITTHAHSTSAQTRTSVSQVKQSTVTPAPEDENTLQCPKCQMSFSQDQHMDLLDHIDECCV